MSVVRLYENEYVQCLLYDYMKMSMVNVCCTII